MADEPQNLVLEHLRAIRGEVGLIREGQAEIALRLASLEQQVAGLRRDFADLRADFVRLVAFAFPLLGRPESVGRQAELVLVKKRLGFRNVPIDLRSLH